MKEKPVLHLMVTNRCHMNCPLCCNRGYNIDEIPVVTLEELKSIDTICITGGEPTLFLSKLQGLLDSIRKDFKNIKNIYLYTTGMHLNIGISGDVTGFSIGPKSFSDWEEIKHIAHAGVFKRRALDGKSDRIYVFPEWETAFDSINKGNEDYFRGVEIIHRKWQKSFKPAPNSFFRRLPILF